MWAYYISSAGRNLSINVRIATEIEGTFLEDRSCLPFSSVTFLISPFQYMRVVSR